MIGQTSCLSCYELCTACKGSNDYCSECKSPGIDLINNKCICKTSDGFYLHKVNGKDVCSPCHRLCKTCHGSANTECDSCRVDVTHIAPIKENTCDCLKQYFDDQTKSTRNTYCQPCYELCARCTTSYKNCQACLPNPGVNFINNKCLCNHESYILLYNSETNKDECLPCHLFCSSCYGTLETQCFSCNENIGAIYIHPDTCACPSIIILILI